MFLCMFLLIILRLKNVYSIKLTFGSNFFFIYNFPFLQRKIKLKKQYFNEYIKSVLSVKMISFHYSVSCTGEEEAEEKKNFAPFSF